MQLTRVCVIGGSGFSFGRAAHLTFAWLMLVCTETTFASARTGTDSYLWN